MLISDWSSDVCSSDLTDRFERVTQWLVLVPDAPGVVQGVVELRMPLVPWVQPLLQFGHLRDRLLALRRDEGHAECRERLAIHPERPAGLDVLWTVAAAIGDDDLLDRKSTRLNSSH